MKRYIDGIKFGMILQLIIGPMCLLVFHTAQNRGFINTIPVILVIAFVDAFYITIASLGVSKILKNSKWLGVMKIVGSIVLIIFGTSTILNEFGLNLIPSLSIESGSSSLIMQTLLLALSNPVTIVFWGSILTTKIVKEKYKRKELVCFCLGLVNATLLFQLFVDLIGTISHEFLPSYLTGLLNILVGIYLIYFGFKNFFEKNQKKY